MSPLPEGLHFSRLLLALGASGGHASVEFSTELAALLALPLEALFIEDEELLAVAALPVTRESSRLGLVLPALEPARLERDLRRHAARLERLVRGRVSGGSTGHRFQVVRGRTATALSAALRPGDLLVISREFGPFSGPGGLGSAVLAALAAGWSGLLLMNEAMPIPPGPVTTWFDRSTGSTQALHLAGRLARGQGRRLRVLLPATETVHLAMQCLLPEHGIDRHELQRLRPDEDPLARLAATRGGLLVLPDRPLGLAGARLEELLRRARVPLVLLRSTTD